ncbi:MAG: transglycosylase SLT domain-containing protein [Gemmatimonas sp.]|nr:transglycosylase SLT domain-containing protein [Gemmatimonas sp.]
MTVSSCTVSCASWFSDGIRPCELHSSQAPGPQVNESRKSKIPHVFCAMLNTSVSRNLRWVLRRERSLYPRLSFVTVLGHARPGHDRGTEKHREHQANLLYQIAGRPCATLRRRTARATAPLVVILVTLVAAEDAAASRLKLQPVELDTLPAPGPKLLGKEVTPPPTSKDDHRGLLGHPSQNEVEIEVLPPTESERAAAFARLYRIPRQLALEIVESAVAEGIDPDLGFRLVRVESVFDPQARGSGGGLGLTQLLPSTARSVDPSLRTEAQILDIRTNLRTGFRYLRSMLDLYTRDVKLALLAYNRGQGAVDQALRAGRDPENGYSEKVLGVSGSVYRGDGVSPVR